MAVCLVHFLFIDAEAQETKSKHKKQPAKTIDIARMKVQDLLFNSTAQNRMVLILSLCLSFYTAVLLPKIIQVISRIKWHLFIG